MADDVDDITHLLAKDDSSDEEDGKVYEDDIQLRRKVWEGEKEDGKGSRSIIEMDFEDLLEAVGSYGTYQKRIVYGFLFPISFVVPFLCCTDVFMLSAPPHGCFEPTVALVSNFSVQERMDLVRPPNHDLEQGTTHDSCKMYNISYDRALDDMLELGMSVKQYVERFSSNWSTTSCQDGWEYEKNLYHRTIVTDYNLVCGDSYYVSLVFTMNTLGRAIGTPILGSLSDRIGRKLTFLITSIIGVLFSFLTVIIPGYAGFTVIRAIHGTVFPSVFQLPFLILVEIVSPEMRTRMNGILCILFSLGLCLISFMAWLTATWYGLAWFSAVAMVPFIGYFWFLPESPRWLISKERFEEASELLKNIARVNGKDVSHLDMIAVLKKCAHCDAGTSNEREASPLEIFKNPTIRKRFFFVAVCWIADSMTYYVFQINISNLYGNEFINYFLLSIVEVPSYMLAWYVMKTRLGRRWSHVIFLFITGFICLLPAMAPSGDRIFMTVASLVGKFGIAASFMVMYQQSAEIFPTLLRASAMSIAGTISSVISISAPNIVYLGKFKRHIPYTVMAFISLAAFVCSIFIPETLNEHLPQTIQDGENFGKDKPFFSFANTKTSELNEHVRSLSVDYSNAAKTEMKQFASDNKNTVA